MKRVVVVINEGVSERLIKAFKAEGFLEFTITTVRAREKDGGIDLEGRAGTYHLDILNKAHITLLVEDHEVERLKGVVKTVCQTIGGYIAGRLSVHPVEEVISLGELTGTKPEAELTEESAPST